MNFAALVAAAVFVFADTATFAKAPVLAAEEPKVDPYPAVRPSRRAFAFVLEGKTDAEAIRKALAGLATKDTACAIAFGPVGSPARPKRLFVLVEAPVTTAVKDVQKALEKGVGDAEALSFTCFDGGKGDGDVGSGVPGAAPRDFVVGMSNDLRWVEGDESFRAFYGAPGKLTAAAIADKFTKLMEPFRGPTIGQLVVSKITWPLVSPVDPAAAKRAEKALAKLAGVRSATIDAGLAKLWLEVALEDARSSGPLVAATGKQPGDAARNAPHPTFDTWPVFEVLDREKLAIAAAAPKAK